MSADRPIINNNLIAVPTTAFLEKNRMNKYSHFTQSLSYLSWVKTDTILGHNHNRYGILPTFIRYETQYNAHDLFVTVKYQTVKDFFKYRLNEHFV